jgi:hypothetical protein
MVETERILRIMVEASRPLLAGEIVELFAKQGVTGIDRSSLNHSLYGPLKARVCRDDRFRWSLTVASAVLLKSHPLSEPLPGFGLNYPGADYYRDRIRDGMTLSWRPFVVCSTPHRRPTNRRDIRLIVLLGDG